MKIQELEGFDTPLGAITDWNSLGAYLDVPTYIMSYVLREKHTMQQRIRIDDRIVYKSAPHLRGIQNRIMLLAEEIFEALPDNDCVLSYRKGVTASDVVRMYQSPKKLISFDIRKCYDNITIDHIAESLQRHSSLPKSGAVLVARYCTVKQRGRETLQQGSPASPALSNLVGYDMFDVPIREWLHKNYPELDIKYVRYCDNVALFVHDDTPGEFVEAFKYFVKEHCKSVGFVTHKWEAIADNNPHKHQKFLGVIVNAEARVDKERVDTLRAILFNWCRYGTNSTVYRFARSQGIFMQDSSSVREERRILRTKFRAYLRGHIQYVKRVNSSQGLMLEKLFAAADLLSDPKYRKKAEIIQAEIIHGFKYGLVSSVFALVKDYKNPHVDVQEYLAAIENELKS